MEIKDNKWIIEYTQKLEDIIESNRCKVVVYEYNNLLLCQEVQ